MESIYVDGQQYDRLFHAYAEGEDLAFYRRQAVRWGAPVLELACGTGRLTIPLAESGIEIVGLDIADSMLDSARTKATERGVNVPFVRADVRDFDLGRTFGLIFFPINSLSHLHSLDDIARCFACVRKHLSSTGRFVIDIFNPSLSILSRDPDGRYPIGEYVEEDGTRVIVTENNRYDAATQINHIRWHYQREGEPEIVRTLEMRQFFPQELEALLAWNGFVLEVKYGDFAETPFTSKSRQQLVVCRAR